MKKILMLTLSAVLMFNTYSYANTDTKVLNDTYNLTLPEIPNLQDLIKKHVESRIESTVRKWAEEQALAMAKSMSGPVAAVVDNVDIEMDTTEAKTELPSVTVGKEVHSFTYHAPEVIIKTKTIASLDIPEFYMGRERLPNDHHHCKTEMKTKNVGLGVKIDVPEVKCWNTPAYANVPKTRMIKKDFKTDVPEVIMKENIVKMDVPSFKTGTSMVSMNVPKIKKITFKVDGILKEIVPGGAALNTALEIIQEAEDFRKDIENEVDQIIENHIDPILKQLSEMTSTITNAIDQVQNKYASIIVELENTSGDHSKEIRKQKDVQTKIINDLKNKLKPITVAANNVDNACKSVRSFIKDLKLI